MKIQNKYINIYIMFNKENICIKAKIGETLLQAIYKSKIQIKANCGGQCACITCLVHIEEEFFFNSEELQNIKEEEMDLLEQNPYYIFNSRLSCQLIITKNMNNINIKIDQDSLK